jgi:dTDP-glucose pyrophosphorylase
MKNTEKPKQKNGHYTYRGFYIYRDKTAVGKYFKISPDVPNPEQIIPDSIKNASEIIDYYLEYIHPGSKESDNK